MATTTDLTTLKINYLTQAQYDEALSGGTINENEIYLTPAEGSGSVLQHYFMGRLGSLQSTTANSSVGIPWTITRQNPSGSWTRQNSNKELICPASGYWEVSSILYWTPTTSSNYSVRAELFVNDTSTAISQVVSAAGVATSVVIAPIILNLTAGDYLSLYLTASGAGNINQGDPLSRIVIRRIT